MNAPALSARRVTRCLHVPAALGCATLAALAAGCQSQEPAHTHAANPALRQIQCPGGGSATDADRAALARLVGIWSFEGWTTDAAGARQSAAGRAAGTIESQHFVLLDVQATSGQFAGRAGRKCGSMLFASEPGVGATLTAWGDASPAVSRLVGHIDGNGSAFCYSEAQTPADRHRVAMTITFETDDRFAAEITDATAAGAPVVAKYQFTRAAK